MPGMAKRSQARRGLIERFVAMYDDDPDLTLFTDLQEAILHLPPGQQGEARILLQDAELDDAHMPLKDLLHRDPDSY